MDDLSRTIVKYALILILVYVALRFILPLLLELIGMILLFFLKIIIFGAIVAVLYLVGNYLYQTSKK